MTVQVYLFFRSAVTPTNARPSYLEGWVVKTFLLVFLKVGFIEPLFLLVFLRVAFEMLLFLKIAFRN